MRKTFVQTFSALLFTVVVFVSSGCLTSAKLDRYVAQQYNNELPKQKEQKKTGIVITSPLVSDPTVVSNSVQKTSKVLPLIVYWSFDWRHTCTLNPAIALASFSNTLSSASSKAFTQKIAGRRLELSVEQVPAAFAIVDKAHMIWLIYAFGWDKVYVEPDAKDMVVSYKLVGDDGLAKSGKITVKSQAENKGIRFFQSWKSATSEYLTDYEAGIALMTKSFVNKLTEEL